MGARTRSLSRKRSRSPARPNNDDGRGARAASKRSTSRVRDARPDKEKKETSKRPVNALVPRDEDREKKSRKVDKETGIKVRDIAAEDARDVTKDNKDDGRRKKVVVLRKRSPSAKDRKSK